MAKEKDVLIEFLDEYSLDAVDNAIGMYKKIQGGISIVDIKGKVYFLKFRSESTPSKFYEVSINVLTTGIDEECNCPAMGRFGSCKHAAAAAMYILIRAHGFTFEKILEIIGLDEDEEEDDDLDIFSPGKEIYELTGKRVFTEKNVVELLPAVTPVMVTANSTDAQWKSFPATPTNVFYAANSFSHGFVSWQALDSTTIDKINEQEVLINFIYKHNKSTSYHPQIRYDRDQTFFHKCDCSETGKMCAHVRAAFGVLEKKDNRQFFLKYKDWSKEKNNLLAPYGLTLADPEARSIEFTVDHWGNIVMKQPSWLWKTDITENVKGIKQIFVTQNTRPARPLSAASDIIDFETGFLFNLVSQHFRIGFEFETVKVYQKNNKTSFKKLSIHQNDTFSLLRSLPDDVYELLHGITNDGVKKHLLQEGYGSGVSNYSSPWNQLGNDALKTLKRYYIAEVQKLWPYLCGQEHVFILKEGTFTNSNIARAKLSQTPLKFSFTLTEDARYITVSLQAVLDGVVITASEIKRYCGFLFEINDVLHIPADIADIDVLKQFEHGFIKIPVSGKKDVIRSVIPVLQRRYQVEVPVSLTAQLIQAEPQPQVLLKELDGKFLVLQPQYIYQEFTVNYTPSPDSLILTLPDDGSCVIIERNTEKEKDFFDSLRVLHPKFQKPTQNDFFFLPFEDTMKQNWFIETVARLVENKIPVMGMQELKKHRYNTNKPKWEMKTGSGIDWFDLQIQISFGEQAIALRDVRKALLSKQNIVVLGDGTFGVLPEEWLKQYGLLLKMGDEQKDGTLRVSKLHYTLIDELHSQIDDDEIMREINEKKQRLQNIGNIKSVKPGKEIKATLRPYQLSGFQWFHTLDEMGWGGCLADDMGLGKTLQTITFLQYLKGKYKGSTHLVICPTSLIYNWENELQKFGPALKYHIYYGLEREFTEEHFNEYDIVITSYGLIRNDLKDLMQFNWHYIILDESQAIKNPDAQTNKALQLLKSKNRMILSGTPIQNNTYDLYAQFHFINPGLLGNREFFKTEFANPIDRNNDTEKSAQLRRLIYPFMLRRTKAQVEVDLPDKTETVLWCEMGKEQRAVYNDYKNYYRNALMEKIAEVGMAKAGMYVLEGLLRLRQVCDSPQLVKDNEVTTNKSIKIDELLREIEENSGGHKLLVFSQFTEMLHLIEENLRSQKVDYVYLDGSTPAQKRKEAVQTFQEDPDIRVFLISLKAGGVGLNLTAADYVYIVDPWWNPAVEQQAIDRTHRIGQVNKIFAYKMICKDTVEEKILQLQQRKKQLANELVTEDAGFIKKLTKDDIAFLFS